jgi:DNA (cytosine-5)-methyltransferase 1
MSIPIIDLFAGPGGLGEGFSALRLPGSTEKLFQIGLSVEKDSFAHQTLELRSFFRQFPDGQVPDDYYEYLEGTITREALFAAHPDQAAAASREAMLAELGESDRGTSDNRKVFQRIREVLGANPRTWVLIGGPPCQAYSTAGRARMRGADPEKFEKDRRQLLYREYLKIIARFRPSVFVMENVKGMLSATLNGEPIVSRIFADLRSPRQALREPAGGWEGQDPHYRIYSLVVPTQEGAQLDPEDYLIRAEQYGIPQTRHRVILLGVRHDVARGRVPAQLLPSAGEIPVQQVIGDLPAIRSQLSKRKDVREEWLREVLSVRDAEFMDELEEGSGLFGAEVARAICQAVTRSGRYLTNGGERLPGVTQPTYNPTVAHGSWYTDPRLRVTLNHTARAHMPSDLHRYLFVSCFGAVNHFSPKTRDFPRSLLPNHKNILEKPAEEEDIFDDRFRVQVRDRPATTITSHISKDGHYNIHFDPSQCRALTVREAARIQTFPDNYFFEGPRTEQYKQVGNAVPPLLAYKIAQVVYNFLRPAQAQR